MNLKIRTTQSSRGWFPPYSPRGPHAAKQLFSLCGPAHKKRLLLSGPYLIWIVGFIILPTLFILYYALTAADGSLTMANVLDIVSPVNRKAMLLSLQIAVQCTVVCILLSYPLAMILNRFRGKSQSLIVFIFILPMWMNFMLRILAWKMLLSNNGVINSLLEVAHLPGIDILNTPAAVVFCMAYDFLPFMILPIYNSMGRISPDLIEAAQDLGAGYATIFFRVILPLTASGVVSGVIMVFIPALTSFAISDIIGGGKVLMIGNVIEQSFMLEYNWNAGSGLSFVLMLFVIISMMLMNSHDKEGGAGIW